MSNEDKLKLFSSCDMRIGRVFDCVDHPDSDEHYAMRVDIGDPEGHRTIICPL
jgi:tRNA-binding EMAP/Myf-like protein